MARTRRDDQWARATIDIALELSSAEADQITEITTTVFLPLELDALAGNTTSDPRQIVDTVRRHLAPGGH